ncbi:50S ribosomal protein L6 [Candidatus Woesearchaeota archaeon]|nr:50S ribosomal protein L6 [Candidatus Woesearchaeota archaeon]
MAKSEQVELPQGVTASYKDGVLSVKGPNGEVSRPMATPGISLSVQPGKVVLEWSGQGKRMGTMIGTSKAHLRNMVSGVFSGHVYRMKICSGHFPMNVAVSGQELQIKNFFGEKHPRKLRILPGIKVKVEGQELVVESPDIDAASQFAASVEQVTRRSSFDRRIFMDGIYIIRKSRDRQ